ncbi:glycosyl transferase, partial [Nocardioides sp. GCM10030258]
GEAFERDSTSGRWEQRALDAAESLWLVNEPIADHYRERYPELADKVRVVRNGFDRDSIPTQIPQPAVAPLRFG